MEDTVHVTFQFLILMDLPIAELLDGLWKRKVLSEYFLHFQPSLDEPTLSYASFFDTGFMDGLQGLQQLWRWILHKWKYVIKRLD